MSVFVCVIERPQPPASSPVVCVLSSHSLILSWSGPCYDGGSAITGYVVEVQTVGSTGEGCWTEFSAGCKSTSLRVSTGLQPQAEYRFRVRARNAVGLSEPSPESQVIRMDSGTGEKRQWDVQLQESNQQQAISLYQQVCLFFYHRMVHFFNL